MKARNASCQALAHENKALEKARSKHASTEATVQKSNKGVEDAKAAVQRHAQLLQNQSQHQQHASVVEQRRAAALDLKRYPIDDQALLQVQACSFPICPA